MLKDDAAANDEANANAKIRTVNDEVFVRHSFDIRIRLDHCLSSLLIASTNIGSLLCDGIGDAILVQGEEAPGQSLRLSYNILQAAGSRIFKTDYVACPSLRPHLV